MSYVVNTVRRSGRGCGRGSSSSSSRRPIRARPTSSCAGILEETGLRCGSDFFLAFSPEREDPGNSKYSTATIPKVVGGVDEISGDLAQALYDQVVVRTVRVVQRARPPRRRSSPRTSSAPSTSPSSTSSRSSSTGWASTSGRCSTPLRPSPSASCASTPGRAGAATASRSTRSTSSWKAREYGVTPKFIELAGEVNVQMPHYVVEKLQLALNDRRKAMQGQPGPGPRARLQEGHRRPAREPGLRDHRELLQLGAEVTLPRPARPEGAADALLARPCRR